MNEEEKNYRWIVVLTQLLGFTFLYYVLCCALLNVLNSCITSISDFSSFKLEFSVSFFFCPALLDRSSAVLIAAVISLFTVWKLSILYNIKHGNKNIKGKSRFARSKEIDNVLYSYDEKNPSSAEKSGIPLYRKNGRIFVDASTIHSLIIGTTRSGKDQSVIMPMIRHIAASKAKHSLVINDPKGETLENLYGTLIDNGYEICILNLEQTSKSSLWNPLQIIINEYVRYRKSKDPNDDLSRCMKLCEELASVFTHNDKSDPIWPESARSLLVAMILYLIEKGYDSSNLGSVSLYSVYQLFIEFGTIDEIRGNNRYNALDELFQKLPVGNPAKSAYATSNFAKGEMRSSVFATLASNMRIFGSDVGVAKLTSGNEINFLDLVNPEKPMAIFMIVPDYEKTRYPIASAFVNQAYSTLAEFASESASKSLPQRVHFILNEFGNMVYIPDMDTKITVAAGRNMLFDLVVQDLNQLDSLYMKEAKTIRGNCGNLVYINSIDDDTNKYFSSLLGDKTIEYRTYSGSLHSWLDHQSGMVDARPLIDHAELSILPEGTTVTKRQRCYPIKAQFEFFYKQGLQKFSLNEICSALKFRSIKLEDTLYPLDSLWSEIVSCCFIVNDNGELEEVVSETAWVNKALELVNTGKYKWDDTRTENRLARKLVCVRNADQIRSDFVRNHGEFLPVINRIFDMAEKNNSAKFTEFMSCLEILKTCQNKKEAEKTAKKAIDLIRYLGKFSLDERSELEKFVNNLHNGQ